jgi:hypothetical protein
VSPGTISQIQFVDQHPPDSGAALEHIRTALEAGCEALLTMQLLRARAVGAAAPTSGDDVQLVQAIESLRRGIAELRLACHEEAGVLTLGFVVGAGREVKRRGRKSSFKAAPNGIDRRLDAAR